MEALTINSKLLGYGSVKQPQVQPQFQAPIEPKAQMLQTAPEKNAKTVTKMNKRPIIQFDSPAMKQYARELNRKLAKGLKGQVVNEANSQMVEQIKGFHSNYTPTPVNAGFR